MLRALIALARAAHRELRWGLWETSLEVAHWRRLAESIPDPVLRHDALDALSRKRAHIDGAAFFWTLPRARSRELLRLLVAYEILADFLDSTSERGAHAGISNGLRLHCALIEALDPHLRVTDYYQEHPWSQDAGYLRALVDACREACVRLPAYRAVQPCLVRAASLVQVQALHHELDTQRRAAALREWADAQFPDGGELLWFEWAGGTSAWLTVLALFALAADSQSTTREAEAVYGAYLPWVSLLGTMLDSYGDQDEDATSATPSYIAQYPTERIAIQRIAEVARRSITEITGLQRASCHLVILSCMTAMYLSKDTTRTPQRRSTTRKLAVAAGPLTPLLLPILRAWRVLYGLRAA